MSILDRIRRQKWPKTGAVIVAAGEGRRMEGIDKQFALLCGKPALAWTVSAFQEALCISEIVVVARSEQLGNVHVLKEKYGFDKLLQIVPGGSTRPESVRRGLKALSRSVELAAVQDGARPLVTPALIQVVVEKAMVTRAAAPGIPVTDTVKQVDEAGKVVSTPDRAALRAVQTPQVFQRHLLQAAWKRAEKETQDYTDDCAAVEAFGVPVYLVEGSRENLKLTTPEDLLLAEQLLKGRAQS